MKERKNTPTVKFFISGLPLLSMREHISGLPHPLMPASGRPFLGRFRNYHPFLERTFYPSRNASPGSAPRVDVMAQLTQNEFPTSLCSLPINHHHAPPPFRCRRRREAEARRAAFKLLFFPSRNTPENMRPEGPRQAFFAAVFHSSQNPTERYLNILCARFYISTNLQLYKLPKSSI